MIFSGTPRLVSRLGSEYISTRNALQGVAADEGLFLYRVTMWIDENKFTENDDYQYLILRIDSPTVSEYTDDVLTNNYRSKPVAISEYTNVGKNYVTEGHILITYHILPTYRSHTL